LNKMLKIEIQICLKLLKTISKLNRQNCTFHKSFFQ